MRGGKDEEIKDFQTINSSVTVKLLGEGGRRIEKIIKIVDILEDLCVFPINALRVGVSGGEGGMRGFPFLLKNLE